MLTDITRALTLFKDESMGEKTPLFCRFFKICLVLQLVRQILKSTTIIASPHVPRN